MGKGLGLLAAIFLHKPEIERHKPTPGAFGKTTKKKRRSYRNLPPWLVKWMNNHPRRKSQKRGQGLFK